MNFKLSDQFIDSYRDKTVPWGYRDAGHTALGEIVFLRSYSRKKEDGTKETWADVCRRVTEGTYSIQKDWCRTHKLTWSNEKAQQSAKEFFDRLFHMKWTPAGRGLWAMGSTLVNDHKSMATLVNCAFVTTNKNITQAATWLMDASMLGIGVGFDVRGAGQRSLVQPPTTEVPFIVEDSREGWVSVLHMLLTAYLRDGNLSTNIDYSLIRPEGAPIVTAGGTAPGPVPLIKMVDRLNTLFQNAIDAGTPVVDSRMIVDIMNIVGDCVVSGGVRRTAEIAFSTMDDADFMKLKDLSVFPYRKDWYHLSNNSIFAKPGEDLSPILDGIKLNGEPGVVWLDTVQNYGRLADAPDRKDKDTLGLNPCLTGDSLLLTENGWISFEDAYNDGNPNNIVVDERVSYVPSEDGLEHPENWKFDFNNYMKAVTMSASHVFLTQHDADIVKITTSTGMDVRLTPDHLVATKRGMVPAIELIPGEDKVLITRGHLPSEALGDPQTQEEIDAVLMGLLAGDGTYASGKVTEKAYICLWGEDQELADKVSSWVQRTFEAYKDTYKSGSNRPFTASNTTVYTEAQKTVLASSFLAAYLKGRYGFSKSTKHVVPQIFIGSAVSRAARFYVAALAYCDGTVNVVKTVGSSNVRIAQSNKKMLKDVQLILLANGITSSVYLRRKAGTTFLPNGKGMNVAYSTKAQHELIIMANAYEYAQYVGFLYGEKNEKAAHSLTPSRKGNAYATVLSVLEDGKEDVYCLKEDERRILCANGITMRRCGEIPLEPYELCNLSETYPSNHESKEDFLRTLKFAYLYSKTVSLLTTPWENTNAITQKNRRIGVSMSGITDFVDTRGYIEMKNWQDAGFRQLKRMDVVYSEWLCVRESIRLSTAKPSGTVSLLAGVSPGVHWTPGGPFFLRRIIFTNNDPILAALQKSGYKVEPSVYSPDTSSVVAFPVESRARRSDKGVSIFEKAHIAAMTQKWWSDNAVSCTVSFSEDEADQIGDLLQMYDGELKGISFLPPQPEYPQMPYEEISKETFEELGMNLFSADFSSVYTGGVDAEGEKYCSNDSCEIPVK